VTLRGFADRKAILIVLAGSIVGPVLGIWMLMVALNGIAAGVAVALVSTSPIMMIPITFVAYRDRPTLRGIVGTCVAIGGIFVLMWK
jgi:drug/metabolite transporter (DMT)-like permease